jgi:hypothetical protein
MRNRAKCRLCNDILESIHRHDYISCKCEEIAIDGGTAYHKCHARNWENFIRVDDEGNEVIPKIVQAETIKEPSILQPPALKETDAKTEIDSLIETYENLPQDALIQPITHYQYLSLLYLLKAQLVSRGSI